MTSRLLSSFRSDAIPTRTPRGDQHTRGAMEDRGGRHVYGGGAYRPWTTPAPSRLTRELVGLNIVVVDDEDDSLEYFAVVLRTCGASVVTASNGADGLRLVREQHPDVVLTDIAMAGHDGYWLVREIRGLADQATRLLPVVATTAYGREHSRARTLAAGFNDHLPKPVDPELLCRTIARAAGR